MAPEKKIKKLLTKKLTLKKAALSFVTDSQVIDKKSVTKVALKVVQSYEDRIASEVEEGSTKAAAIKAIASDPKLLIQRVQNEVIYQVKENIRSNYYGKSFVWLPSDANDPRPEHQLNYGKTFVIADDTEIPGDAYGCRCGMEILTDDKQLNLKDEG